MPRTSIGPEATDLKPIGISNSNGHSGGEPGVLVLDSDTQRKELARLFQQYSQYFVGLFCSLLLGFLSFPVFTRIFSVTDYGTLDLIQKIVTLLIAVAKLGFQHGVVRFYDHARFANDRGSAQTFYSTMFFGGASTALTVTLVFVGIVIALPNAIIGEQFKKLLVLASALIFLGGVESVQWGFLRNKEQTKLYSVAMISIKAGTLAFVYILIWFGHRGVYVFFAGAIGAEALVVAVLIFPLFRRGCLAPHFFNRQLFVMAASFGAPLVVYELSNIVLDSGDRVLVRQFLGGESLGRYSVAYNIAGYVYQLVLVPLNLALVPMYMKLWRIKGRQETIEFLSRGLDLFILLAAALMSTIIVTAEDAIVVLASEKYRGSGSLVSMIAAGLLIYAMLAFFAAGLLIFKKSFVMVRQVSYAAAANLALNCLLLPLMGVRGAALATLLGYVLCILLLARSSSPILPVRVEPRRLIRYLCAGSISVWVTSFLAMERPLPNLLCRCVINLVVYFAVLTLVDRSVRNEAIRLLERVRPRSFAT